MQWKSPIAENTRGGCAAAVLHVARMSLHLPWDFSVHGEHQPPGPRYGFMRYLCHHLEVGEPFPTGDPGEAH